ncbi:MAG: hypothetical protein JNM40_08875 [Myxococcales bacterium]|nr:hypothetical protein [Myxococcales bacterium]
MELQSPFSYNLKKIHGELLDHQLQPSSIMTNIITTNIISRTVIPLLLLAVGCTSYELQLHSPAPQLPMGPPGTGQICVVRPSQLAALVPAVVQDNGALVGMTRGPSYFCYLAAPGYHLLSTFYGDDIDHRLGTGSKQDLTVLVPPSGRVYVHHDVSAIMSLSVSMLSEADATAKIAGCYYVTLSSVPSGAALPQPGAVLPAQTPRE